MTWFALQPHPRARGPQITIMAEVIRTGPSLHLRFVLGGLIDRILLEDSLGGERVDGLWRSTCMEAFVRPVGDAGYLELNFSSSQDWASYQFDDYRAGMRPADVEPAFERIGPSFRARCDLSTLASFQDVVWQLGLSAVIEETDGAKSYWALAHPPGPPDFHDPACFIATLPAPGRP